jgi:2',3'-cyclic-nucleotide 2'-phosphodiesterase/3'-nucleotidase/5'-nucleotidase
LNVTTYKWILPISLAFLSACGSDSSASKQPESNPQETTEGLNAAEAALDADAAELLSGSFLGESRDFHTVVSDVKLPSSASSGSQVAWLSKTPLWITNAGEITVPSLALGNQAAELSATLTHNGLTRTVSIKLVILAQPSNDSEKLQADAQALTLGSSISENLNLPISGTFQSQITWTSDRPEILSAAGDVKRPPAGSQAAKVILTATLSRENFPNTIRKSFTISVLPSAMSDWEAVQRTAARLSFASISGNNRLANEVVYDLHLAAFQTSNDTRVSWVSSHPGYLSESGKIQRPPLTVGDTAVTFSAIIEKGSERSVVPFELIVLARESKDEAFLRDDAKALNFDAILNGNLADSVSTDLNLPSQVGPHGSSIVWTSSDESVISSAGKVSCPTDVASEVRLLALLSRNNGEFRSMKAFVVLVSPCRPVSKRFDSDYERLERETFLDGQKPNAVTGNLLFPTVGEEGSTITWTTSNASVIDANGVVNRPVGKKNSTVIIEAKVSLETFSKTKTFIVTVLAKDHE